VAFDIYLLDGMNLMSLPLIPDETDPVVALADVDFSIAAMYKKSEEAFKAYIKIFPPAAGFVWQDGLGYWFNMNSADTFTFDGHVLDPYPAPPPAYEVLYVDDGWNLMGFTSTTSKTPEVYLDSIWDILVLAYGYDQELGYFIPGTPGHEYMEPGQGYWINVSDNGILYPYGEGESMGRSGLGILDIRKQLMADPTMWDIDLKVNSSLSAFTSQVTCGAHPDATESYDIYLDGPAPPPPPMKELVEAYIWQPENTESWNRKLSIDYSPPADTITWPLKIDLRSASRSDQFVTVTWDKTEVEAIPKEYELHLLDENGKELVDMREVTSYRFKVKIPKGEDSQTATFQIQAQSR